MSNQQDSKKIPVDREDLLLLLRIAIANDQVDWIADVDQPVAAGMNLKPGMFVHCDRLDHILGDLRITDFPELEPPEKEYTNWNCLFEPKRAI